MHIHSRLKGLTVNLHGALSLDEGEYNEEEYKKPIYLQSGSSESKQSFFPLAVDDYFMSVAILSKRFSSEEPKVNMLEHGFTIYLIYKNRLELALCLMTHNVCLALATMVMISIKIIS